MRRHEAGQLNGTRTVLHVVPASRSNPWLADAIRAGDSARWRQVVVSVAPAGELQREMAGNAASAHALGANTRAHYPVAAVRLTRLVRHQRVDLIHAHLFDANILAAGARRLAAQVPLVITRHEPPDFIRMAPVAGWKRRAYLSIDGALTRSAAAVIAPSARTEDELIRLGVPAGRIHRIPLGLDLARIARADEAGTSIRGVLGLEGRACVGVFGRMSWEKSVDTALRAWPAVLAARPDAVLVLAGDGPQRNALAHLARELGTERSVRFVGWRDDVPALMSAMDVVLHTSRTESTGMVLIEALVRGRPLVVTPVGIVGEHLRHEEDCLVVPHASPEDVSRAIMRLLADPGHGRALAEHGRARVLDTFGTGAMVSAYGALYERVLGAAT